MYSKDVTVQNQVGLHARPATFFIQKANEFKASIWVEKEERRVNAKSLLGVLSLGIVGNTTIRVIADGVDEEAAVEALVTELSGDEQTGARIIATALQAPIRQIAENAGVDGSVVFEKIKSSKKVGYGYNAYTETYMDMIENGIVDPTKVTRSSLENAASIAACVLTTESLVADKPNPQADAAAMAAAAQGGGMY